MKILAGSGLLAAAATSGVQTASAQETSIDSMGLEEIVVTARRKDESLQDVPTTINAVTGEDIAELNIRKFEDIATVVPGLSMGSNQNGIGATASVRGVNYDVNASGNNGTVEFYLNDAPISAGNLFQTMYDFQQVELLRGPQGTLRGRASPSGSMTVTTRRPDLGEMGGFVSATGTNIGGKNGQGAIGVPILTDMLAIRVAGVYDENEGNRVRSFNSTIDPESKTKSGRATLLFEPTGNLQFVATYQKTDQDITAFDQVESIQSVNPAIPLNPAAPGSVGSPFFDASARLSVQDAPRVIEQQFENINLQGQFAFLGQKLNYVGARNDQHLKSFEVSDVGDFFPVNYPAFTKGYGQSTDSRAKSYQHELRLSSEERIIGIFDYIVGAFYQTQDSPTDLKQATAVLFGAPSPTVGGLINLTPITRTASTHEKSAFVNLTAQLFDALEVSGGFRHIKYNNRGALYISGARLTAADQDVTSSANIYTVSVKYTINDNMMVYANTGTSWRPGATAVGDFSLVRTPLENSFINLPPEESTSYEIGFKASALDNRLRAAVSVYHQTFDNYPYRSASGVYFVETVSLAPLTERVRGFNFIAAVPVEVNGIEADIAYQPFDIWDVGVVASYAKGEIQDGLIPCDDYSPRDGVPDSGGAPPTVSQIRTATGGDNLSACRVDYRSSSAPLWSGTVRSDLHMPVTDALTGYFNALVSLYGDSENDPANTVDDYDSYALLNLYLGIRDADGKWDVALYGKNVTGTERVLARVPWTTPYNIGAAGQTGLTNYYGGSRSTGLAMTNPREFGVNVRYAFGSR